MLQTAGETSPSEKRWASLVLNRKLAELAAGDNGGVDACRQLCLEDMATPDDVRQFQMAAQRAANARLDQQNVTPVLVFSGIQIRATKGNATQYEIG